ncbi:hypothetical protein XENOCAPTIV_001898 [Xenoophorus captivus]|uniref:Uncharacterized protein n=1 Tax=Xenoophorus captivus TaxID=1517983 RepID=A0ABV0RN65_9TELE
MVCALLRNSLNPELHIQLTNEKTIGELRNSLAPFPHTFPYTFYSLFPLFSCKGSCYSLLIQSSCTVLCEHLSLLGRFGENSPELWSGDGDVDALTYQSLRQGFHTPM